MDGAKSRRCYFDLADMIKGEIASGYFPYTPAATDALRPLREALNIIFERGPWRWVFFPPTITWPRVVRAAITQGWRLKLCAKEPKWYSDTVSAIVVPGGYQRWRTVIDVAFPPLQPRNWAAGAFQGGRQGCSASDIWGISMS